MVFLGLSLDILELKVLKKRYDGVEIPFFSHTRKVKYYDVVTDDVIEKWDNSRQQSAIEQNDPTDLYSGFRSGAINTND